MKQLVLFLTSMLLLYAGFSQGDYPKYSKVSGYGFLYKRHAADSVQLVPLSTSPHTPYRAGAIRWSVTDSTFQGYTGSQWLDMKPYQINDSAFVFAGDTITIRGTGGGGSVDSANNGLSQSSNIIQIGQSVGAAGNPAALLNNREIPLSGFNLHLTGTTGNFKVGDNSALSTARIQSNTATAFSTTPYIALGPLLSNSIYSTLHTSDTVTVANEATIPIRGYQMNRNLVLGANGNVNLTGKNGSASVNVIRVRDTVTLNATGHNNWYANSNQLSFLKAGGYSGRSSVRGGVDGLSDAPSAMTAELVIAGSTGSNNFHFYGDWTSLVAELAHTSSAQDTVEHYMSVWANANYAGKIGRAEYFRAFGLGVPTDTLYSVYFSEAKATGYHQGNFGIGDSLPTSKLQVKGSVAIYKDSVELVSSITTEDIIVIDTVTNKIKRSKISSLPAGTPALLNTQIAFGNQSNLQTSNLDWRYVDSNKAALSRKFLATNYLRSGDTTYRASPYLISYFFGNSITAGSAITPQYYRWPTRTANGLNHIEYNYGIGGTRLVSLVAGDSAMQERTFLVPTYNASRDGYLFFAYGTNDAVTGTIDTATFRSVYNTILADAASKNWPASRVVLVSVGYYIHSNSGLTARGPIFRDVTKSIALINGVRFVDTRTAQELVGAMSTLKLPSDSTHLNEMGNQAWALAILDTLAVKSGDVRANGNMATRALYIHQWANGGNNNAFSYAGVPVAISVTDSTEQIVTELRATKGAGVNDESLGFGLNALKLLTSGNSNLAFGSNAMPSVSTGGQNTSLGSTTLFNLTTGNNNVAVGKNALFTNITNSELVGIGRDALYSNTSGVSNTGVGYRVLSQNATGNNMTAVGYAALENTTSGGNGAFGSVALRNNVGGTNNNAFGSSALVTNVSGSSQTAMGNRALRASTVDFNTAFGANAGDSVTTGTANTLLGYRTGYNLKTGVNNVAIGNQSGLGLVSGNDNIYIGRWTIANATASNTIFLSPGNNEPRFVSISDGKTGLGTASPIQRLHVAGKVAIDTVSNGTAGDSVLTIKNREVQKIALLVVDAGRYAPTLTAITNVDVTTQVDDFHYTRIGNTVNIDGMINIDPTALTTATNVDITLIFSSTMTNFTNLTGIIMNGESVGGQIVAIGNKARIGFNAVSTSSQVYNLHFTYEITP